MKVCTKCKIKKEFSEFHKNHKSNDKLAYICKLCAKKLRKIHYEKNKLKEYTKKTEWNTNNKDKIKLHNFKYKENNRCEINKKNRKRIRLEKITKPWKAYYGYARSRCNCKTNDSYQYYGAKGIKFLMTIKDFKFLWFKDKAHLMEKPSIDRKNSKGNYTLNNCRFIEYSINASRREEN